MEREKDRNEAILAMRADGFSLNEIAKTFGISRHRVEQIQTTEDRRSFLQSSFPEIYEAASALGKSENMATRAAIVVQRSGENWPDVDTRDFAEIRNVGPAILAILEKAMILKKETDA